MSMPPSEVAVPFYVRMLASGRLSRTAGRRVCLALWSLLPFAAVLLACVRPRDVWEFLSRPYAYMGSVLVLFALVLLSDAHGRMKADLPRIHEMMPDDAGRHLLADWSFRMFGWGWQFAVYLALMVAVAATTSAWLYFSGCLPAPLSVLPVWRQIVFHLSVAYVGALVAPGLWLAVQSTRWVNAVTSYDHLELVELLPGRTPGLRVMGSLIGTYSLWFSIESVLAIVTLLVAPYHRHSPVLSLVQAFWALLLIPCIAVYFIWPQLMIERCVSKAKSETLARLARRAGRILSADRDLSDSDIARIQGCCALCREVERASYIPDLTTLRQFAFSVLAPVTAFAVQYATQHHPNWFSSLTRLWHR